MNEIPCLVFTGKKGGGLQVLDFEISNLNAIGIKPRIIVNEINRLRYSHEEVYSVTTIATPYNWKLRNLFKYGSNLWLLRKVVDSKLPFIYFIQSSPWDYPVRLYSKFARIYIKTGIHDISRHKGDFWPLRVSTNIEILLSKEVIFWSNYVANHFNLKKKYEIKILPSMRAANQQVEVASGDYILGIGRIRKYKGFENLVEAFNSEKLKHLSLIIAGEGNLNNKQINKNVSIIRKWLEENEIVDYISRAKIVVFPYLEASQSGLIPIAKQFNKWIIISNNGGLLEQVFEYPKVVVLKDVTPESIVSTILSISD